MVVLTERDPMLVIVDLSRNHGHQLALSAGLQCCAEEQVLVLDADLQDPPELLPQMLELMDQGADVVFAQRRTRLGDAPLKRFACARRQSRIINKAFNVGQLRGRLFAFLCLGFIGYAIYSLLFVGQTPQGWTSLVIVVTLMGSVQLFVLGIIGQYLGRIHEQVRGRPIFIIRDVVRGRSLS